ncbi:NADH-quinone oxidoreductase subunit C [Dehalogenimonas formicexedens]|uniref:NADH-quinone oxidoreductase subunit C n=1 Tax=Dehalogenimonas formicexedens TaxID=1839801 RepID=A0A1P8F6P7_9CHLR|nr:NADH-quinone oxidoreductase subunit C [Dehalogenimonas formicexedens]APV44105.1 NADH-quinone oxidoreductase subunit C [Dehalogenimonas formicexedens]
MKNLDFIPVSRRIIERFGEGSVAADDKRLMVHREHLADIALFLKEDPDLSLDYLNSITGIDHKTHFTVVYHLTSLAKKHRLTFRTDLDDRNTPSLPSVTSVWRGADFQEREIFDLMGIEFTGHPNLKRIFLWEGFPGYPLRKDWVNRDA